MFIWKLGTLPDQKHLYSFHPSIQHYYENYEKKISKTLHAILCCYARICCAYYKIIDFIDDLSAIVYEKDFLSFCFNYNKYVLANVINIRTI